MDPKLQDRLPPPGGGRKKKVSLAVDTAGHNSLSAAPQGSLVVTDNSLRDSSISVGFAGLRVNELANCAAQSSSRQQMPMGQVQHARDGGGSEGDRLALSEFKMVRVLGEGTSGVVKLVRHRPTNRRFAMKVIQLGCSEQERKQILIEVKTLHKSDVPHIIAFTDAFYVDNAVHLILEYMDCGSLHSVLKRHGPLPEPLLARVSGDMLGGLDHLHRVLKVVHRDIKPSNVLLNSRGEVKLADFGMSGQLASTFSRLASWVGTAAYMSPERISGSQVCACVDHTQGLFGLFSLSSSHLSSCAHCAVFVRVGHLGARRLAMGVLRRPLPILKGHPRGAAGRRQRRRRREYAARGAEGRWPPLLGFAVLDRRVPAAAAARRRR